MIATALELRSAQVHGMTVLTATASICQMLFCGLATVEGLATISPGLVSSHMKLNFLSDLDDTSR
jgi:hypothetical protein